MQAMEESIAAGSDALLKGLTHQGTCFMSLNGIIPSAGDLEADALAEGAYLLQERRGFIRSGADIPRKKRTVCVLTSGSTFPAPLAGSISDVSGGEGHPVYRYGIGFFISLSAKEEGSHA